MISLAQQEIPDQGAAVVMVMHFDGYAKWRFSCIQHRWQHFVFRAFDIDFQPGMIEDPRQLASHWKRAWLHADMAIEGIHRVEEAVHRGAPNPATAAVGIDSVQQKISLQHFEVAGVGFVANKRGLWKKDFGVQCEKTDVGATIDDMLRFGGRRVEVSGDELPEDEGIGGVAGPDFKRKPLVGGRVTAIQADPVSAREAPRKGLE